MNEIASNGDAITFGILAASAVVLFVMVIRESGE